MPQNIEDEIRRRIMREKENVDAERIREKELEEESVKLDREIEQEIRGALSSGRDELRYKLSCRIDRGRTSKHRDCP